MTKDVGVTTVLWNGSVLSPATPIRVPFFGWIFLVGHWIFLFSHPTQCIPSRPAQS